MKQILLVAGQELWILTNLVAVPEQVSSDRLCHGARHCRKRADARCPCCVCHADDDAGCVRVRFLGLKACGETWMLAEVGLQCLAMSRSGLKGLSTEI